MIPYRKITRSKRQHVSLPKPAASSAIHRLTRESKTDLARLLGAIGCWLAAMLCLGRVIAAPYAHTGPPLLSLLMCLLCVVGGIAVLPHAHSQSLQSLAASPDVRAIGPLLDALDLSVPAKAPAIRALLITLLPRLQSGDAMLLTPRQRGKLYNALMLSDPVRDLPYLLAILQALEQIGDEETLRRVRLLIQLGAVTPAQDYLRQVAMSCAASLEVRLQQEQTRASLLRPAIGIEKENELLHPAMPCAETQPATLLRPVSVEEDRPAR